MSKPIYMYEYFINYKLPIYLYLIYFIVLKLLCLFMEHMMGVYS